MASQGVYAIRDTGLKDYKEVIQNALDKAKTANGTITVWIGPGTFPVSYILDIYSNTNLVLDKDTVLLSTMDEECRPEESGSWRRSEG